MPRLSRTSSTSSQSYTALDPTLDTSHAAMPYYHSHGRVSSLSANGASGYYDHITDDMPPVLNDNSSMAAMSNQVAYHQHQQQQQHQQHDPYAVGMPLSMGPGPGSGGANAAMLGSSGPPTGRLRPSTGSYPVQLPSADPLGGVLGGSSHTPHTPRTSSGAWSPLDDDTLVRARARGENWAQIQALFPGKTPNACRKRHERLMERRNANDFDTRKMELIAREYMTMRRDIWQPLAQRTGEKWTVVEQKCMASGLKNLQGVSRAASRRQRLESSYAVVGAYTDEDLGGPGGPLHGPLHAPELDLLEAGASSPSGSTNGGGSSGAHHRSSISGGSNSSAVSVSLQPHLLGPAAQGNLPPPSSSSSSSSRRHRYSHSYSHTNTNANTNSHPQRHGHHLSVSSPVAGPDVVSPTYQDYYTQAGFSQSLRTMDASHAGGSSTAAMASPYMGHHQQHAAHAHQQHRLPPADMGIDSLLRR